MSRSLERGLECLIFMSKRKSIGVTELANELNINKSTAFRILDTLVKYNMAEQNKSTAKYKLGPAVLKLSEQLNKNMNIISLAKPVMIKLAEEIKESVHLTVMSNDSAVIIEQIMTSSRLQVNAKIGNAEPLHCSSVGKCLLAFSPDDVKEQILKNMEYTSYTDKTITDEAAMKKEINNIIERGYAVDDGEISEEIKCIAAPIYVNGAALYSMGVSGPYFRMNGDKTAIITDKLLYATRLISNQLGG